MTGTSILPALWIHGIGMRYSPLDRAAIESIDEANFVVARFKSLRNGLSLGDRVIRKLGIVTPTSEWRGFGRDTIADVSLVQNPVSYSRSQQLQSMMGLWTKFPSVHHAW